MGTAAANRHAITQAGHPILAALCHRPGRTRKVFSAAITRVPFAGFLCLLLAGCALPGYRLSSTDYQRAGPPPQPVKYELTPITPAVLQQLNKAVIRADDPRGNPGLKWALANYHYRVGPQDVLDIIVWNHPELTLSQAQATTLNSLTGSVLLSPPASQGAGIVVSSEGTIFFPYAGVLKVADETVDQIRVQLTGALSTYIKNPQINVRVIGFHSKTFQLAGAVMKPGLYPITNVPLTVSEAITAAGGVVKSLPTTSAGTLSNLTSLSLADLSHVILIRNGQREVLNLRNYYRYGDQSQDRFIEPGDIIEVPDNSYNQVHLIGEVQTQGNYPMGDGNLNLAQALGEAGGINLVTSNPERIFVFRGGYERPQVYWLDARSPEAMLLATQFPLEPQDVVYVASTGLADWNRVISQILPTVQTLYETKVLVKQ